MADTSIPVPTSPPAPVVPPVSLAGAAPSTFRAWSRFIRSVTTDLDAQLQQAASVGARADSRLAGN